jgi:hypothetical protein
MDSILERGRGPRERGLACAALQDAMAAMPEELLIGIAD